MLQGRRRMPTWRAKWRAATALGVLAASFGVPAVAQDGASLVVSPPGRKVELRVGERRGFSAVSPLPGVRYAWSLDGAPGGEGTHFEFRPAAAHVGTHEVSVTALAGDAASRHTWAVEVAALAPPKVVRASPAEDVIELPAKEPLRLELEVEGATLTDQVTVQWSVDGAPAGEGRHFAVTAPAEGTRRVRAVAMSDHGGAVMREWRLVALREVAAAGDTASDVRPIPVLAPVSEPAAAKPPARPSAPEPAAPRARRPEREERREEHAERDRSERRAPAAPPPERLARAVAPEPLLEEPPPVTPPPPPPPPPPTVTEDDVRALMFRYEQAWRTRNVAELRRIGHIENDEQERSLAKYFATTRDLEVAVHVKELQVSGGRGTVTFTRRDRFRDPGGREVAQESPAIRKTIVRTPEGVRFAPKP